MTSINTGIMELIKELQSVFPVEVVPGQAGGKAAVVILGATSSVATESITSPLSGSTSFTVNTALQLANIKAPYSYTK
jgi:hypothetical protein